MLWQLYVTLLVRQYVAGATVRRLRFLGQEHPTHVTLDLTGYVKTTVTFWLQPPITTL